MEKILKKKILIISEVFFPEEFKINDIAEYWIKNGYKVDVLTLNPSYPESQIFDGYRNSLISRTRQRNINIFRLLTITGYKKSKLKKILKYFSFMILGSIFILLKGKKYDVIFGFNIGSLTSMLPAVLSKKLHSQKLILWTQDLWPDTVYAYGFSKTKILEKFLSLLTKFIYSNVSAFAISSMGFKNTISLYTNSNKTEFLYAPNWPDNMEVTEEKANLSSPSKINFTFAGNIGKVQNLEIVIEAFNMLCKNYKDNLQLNIIGDGSNLEILKKIAQDKKSIRFYGRQKRKDMMKFYNASDFLIISLKDEPVFAKTIPAKFQTYLFTKKPIFAVMNGEVANLVKDNNLGVVANPGDVNDIYLKFKSLLTSTDQARKLYSNNCDLLLKQVFNKDIVIKRITTLL